MMSPFKFAKHGKSGLEVSDSSPTSAKCIDDLCVIRSMHTNIPNHEPSLLMMTSGETPADAPEHGVVAALRPRQREPEPARLRRPLPRQAGRRPAAVEQQLPARHLPGHAHQQQPDRPEERHRRTSATPTSARSRQREQMDLLNELNEMHLARRARQRQPARSPHPVAGDGLPHAVRGAGRLRPERRRRRRRASCTARATSPTPACWPAGWSSAACAWCRSYTGDGQPWDDHGDIEGPRRQGASRSTSRSPRC